MLGMMEPKKIATIIVGGGEDNGKQEEVDLKKEAQLDAAKQLIKAVEKKDAQMVVDAYMSLKECCSDDGESEEEE
jgi:hypothetical protein